MRTRMLRYSVFVIMLLLLTACQSAPKVDEEDVISESFNKRDEVENYHIISDLSVKAKSPMGNESSKAEIDGVMDEKNDEMNIEITEKRNNEQSKQHLIYKDGNQYLFSGDEWKKGSEEIEEGSLKKSGSTYYNIIESVHEFNQYAEVKKDGEEYIASYDGSAEDVFYIFQDVFNLSLTGADLEEDTTMKVTATFDEKTLFLTSLTLNILADIGVGDIAMDIHVAFKDINESEVKASQEAIDATE